MGKELGSISPMGNGRLLVRFVWWKGGLKRQGSRKAHCSGVLGKGKELVVGFARILKDRAEAAGLDRNQFSGHSLRRDLSPMLMKMG
jgi:hypothetical protein